MKPNRIFLYLTATLILSSILECSLRRNLHHKKKADVNQLFDLRIIDPATCDYRDLLNKIVCFNQDVYFTFYVIESTMQRYRHYEPECYKLEKVLPNSKNVLGATFEAIHYSTNNVQYQNPIKKFLKIQWSNKPFYFSDLKWKIKHIAVKQILYEKNNDCLMKVEKMYQTVIDQNRNNVIATVYKFQEEEVPLSDMFRNNPINNLDLKNNPINNVNLSICLLNAMADLHYNYTLALNHDTEDQLTRNIMISFENQNTNMRCTFINYEFGKQADNNDIIYYPGNSHNNLSDDLSSGVIRGNNNKNEMNNRGFIKFQENDFEKMILVVRRVIGLSNNRYNLSGLFERKYNLYNYHILLDGLKSFRNDLETEEKNREVNPNDKVDSKETDSLIGSKSDTKSLLKPLKRDINNTN